MNKVGQKVVVITASLCVIAAAGFWLIADNEPVKPDVSVSTAPTEAEPEPTMETASQQARPIDRLTNLDFSEPLSEEEADFPATTPRAEFLKKARSLEGTEIAGQLAADDSDNLVMSFQVRDFFDYYLSSVGEVSLQEIVQEIKGYASANLPEPAARQTEQVLEGYLKFKTKSIEQIALSEEQITEQSPEYHLETLRDRVAQLKTLRREFMEPETVEAFFAEEERFADQTIQMMEIR